MWIEISSFPCFLPPVFSPIRLPPRKETELRSVLDDLQDLFEVAIQCGVELCAGPFLRGIER